MTWQICECQDAACAFRFPAETADPRRLHCPVCGADTQCTPALKKAVSFTDADDATRHAAGILPPGVSRPPLYMLLDNLRSTYNVGSIFRTADSVGVSEIHLCGITPTPAHPKIAKTALGAEETMPWRYHRNALHAAEMLHAAGVALWALEIHPQAHPLFEAPPLSQPTALVVGSEVSGVDPALLALCDSVYVLPMLGRKGSLNVASAAAVALYHVRFGR